MNEHDERPAAVSLLGKIRENLASLRELYAQVSDHWTYEDGVYRFYHQSFKVYRLQGCTKMIVDALCVLSPGQMNAQFGQIVSEGTGKTFELAHNSRWMKETRPILEAFFHARFMLEMVIKAGETLERAPALLPSGWATVLYLYGLR